MVLSRGNYDQIVLERDALHAENEQLKSDNKILHEKVQYLLNKLFGKSSEKLSPDQMELALEELKDLQEALENAEEKSEELEEQKNASQRGKRKSLCARVPKDIPTETVVIIPEEVKANPERYKKIGEETTEELDVVLAKFFKRIIIRDDGQTKINHSNAGSCRRNRDEC